MSSNTHLYDVWLSDDFEDELMGMARRGASTRELANRARALAEEYLGLDGESGFKHDLLSWALDDIDWHEIATEIEAQLEDEDEDE